MEVEVVVVVVVELSRLTLQMHGSEVRRFGTSGSFWLCNPCAEKTHN